jgi:Glycosyl hydrolase catalytic core
LEAQDWIVGYAWFSFDIDSPAGTCSALFDKNGELTACGRYYASVSPSAPMGDQDIAN